MIKKSLFSSIAEQGIYSTLYNIEQQTQQGDLHFTILNNKPNRGIYSTLYNIEQQTQQGDLHFTILNNKPKRGIYTLQYWTTNPKGGFKLYNIKQQSH